ncbi:MAG: putative peptide zinc metalloprotease protein [Gammaproteobacteria bacterium]|jgi:putative peptide zinc metalloprotease protein
MSSLFSPSWYRVAALKPRLRGHVQVHRQPYADELNYLLQDHATGKFYRFNPSAYDIIGRMNGILTVHEIWEQAAAHLGEDAPSQDETIDLLGRLHSSDALQVSVSPDCLELFRRSERRRGRRWTQTLRSPLSIRIPLLDPDQLLDRLLPYVSPFLTSKVFFVWVIAMLWAVLVASRHWVDLSADVAKHALEPSNLVLLVLIYPIVKVLHELGHALTTKKWGGQVHETGITLLIFMPVPYVDASAASAIRSKYKRMAVGGAGMAAELTLAALALLVWLNVEPGLVRLAALNVMLISGVSTVIFNGNPLLKFDAYYILKDAIEVPNLGHRSTRQLGYLVQRYLFGIEGLEPLSTRAGERRALVLYGLTSSTYRLLLSLGIIWYIAGEFFVIGILLALWAGTTQIVMPLAKHVSFVLFDRRVQAQRLRAVGTSAALLGGVLAFLLLVPLPTATLSEGVVWLPEDARLRAGIDGHVAALLAKPFTHVRKGQALIALHAPDATARIELLEAELDELRASLRIEKVRQPTLAAVIKEKVLAKETAIAHQQERVSHLTIASRVDGLFVLPNAADLEGAFVKQGDEIGFVIDATALTIRAVVTQDEIGLLREHLASVEVKMAEAINQTIPATIVRAVPAADSVLPSKALGAAGGGRIAVDPSDERGVTALRAVFQYELALNQAIPLSRVGERAYVKFNHGKETLARTWYRRVRQLFLARFGV